MNTKPTSSPADLSADTPAPADLPSSGDTDDSDIERLKATLEKERGQRKDFEKKFKSAQRQFEAFQGLGDPDTIKKALALAAQQEQLELERSRERSELEAKFQQKYEPLLQQERAARAKLQQEFTDFRRDRALEDAYLAAGGFPGEFNHVAADIQKRVRVGDDGLIVLDEQGQPAFTTKDGASNPKTVAELIEELKYDESNVGFARHFKSNSTAGFGTQNGQSLQGSQNYAGMDIWQKVDAMRASRGRA